MRIFNICRSFIIILLVKPVYLLRRIFWKIFKPVTIGVRLLLLTNNNVLLVKHSYNNQWYLPGGKIKARENIEEALHREIREELGINIEKEKINILGIYSNFQEYKKDSIIVFVIKEKSKNEIHLRNLEIRDARYFSIKNLPSDTSLGTRRRIQEFMQHNLSKTLTRKW